jgi:uncharacterized membrane protein YagU involved in acid resistance
MAINKYYSEVNVKVVIKLLMWIFSCAFSVHLDVLAEYYRVSGRQNKDGRDV